MQQTDKYQLNLIENEDTFSPDPLNGNAEKLEAALIRLEGADAAEAQARAAADKALDQRVMVLEGHKIVIGIAALATSTAESIEYLGFTPTMVIASGSGVTGFAIPSASMHGLKIVDGGFQHTENYAHCAYAAFL